MFHVKHPRGIWRKNNARGWRSEAARRPRRSELSPLRCQAYFGTRRAAHKGQLRTPGPRSVEARSAGREADGTG